MVVHMTLNMLIPSFLVGAGPITLLLRASTGTGPLGHMVHARVNQVINRLGCDCCCTPCSSSLFMSPSSSTSSTPVRSSASADSHHLGGTS